MLFKETEVMFYEISDTILLWHFLFSQVQNIYTFILPHKIQLEFSVTRTSLSGFSHFTLHRVHVGVLCHTLTSHILDPWFNSRFNLKYKSW